MTKYRSECTCACHSGRVGMRHIVACCQPDPTNDAPVTVEAEYAHYDEPTLAGAIDRLRYVIANKVDGPDGYSEQNLAIDMGDMTFGDLRLILAALASAPAEPRLNPTPIEALADTFSGKTEVDRLAIILMRAFGKAEPKEGISQHPASYVATFADMARAIIASAPAGDGVIAQARRFAAELLIADGGQHDRAKSILNGSHDEGPTVQAFAAALARPRPAVASDD